ncbi:MAG: hypothetical protein ACRDQF_15730 [Thermocrispum sp.]
MTGVVVAALAVAALSRFVPLGVVQTYVQGAASVVALWPLAYQIWTHRAHAAGEPQPVAA